MARLMTIPIRDKGEAVLIVSFSAGVILMGFVTVTTLRDFFRHPPSTCECRAFVEQHLPAFEEALFGKSTAAAYADETLTCVEIEASDLWPVLPGCDTRDLIPQ
jgi:hypothetical protein